MHGQGPRPSSRPQAAHRSGGRIFSIFFAVANRTISQPTANVVIQAGGTVTWTWRGAALHNLTYTSGPTPLPTNGGNQTSGTHANMITAVGTYGYTCTNHAGMNGTVTVVH